MSELRLGLARPPLHDFDGQRAEHVVAALLADAGDEQVCEKQLVGAGESCMEGCEALGSRRVYPQVYCRYIVDEDCAYRSDRADHYLCFRLPPRLGHGVERPYHDRYPNHHTDDAHHEHPFSLAEIQIVIPPELLLIDPEQLLGSAFGRG